MAEDLKSHLEFRRGQVDEALDRYLPPAETHPATIHQAMRYSLFAGGKRLRPILCIEAADVCGGRTEDALPPAAAVECIHTYSLVHDDLPCMDDDDFRRGRPTSHVVYGEGIAVLAGDALLTAAFEVLASTRETPRHPLAAFVTELAVTAGSRHLVGGQVLDLEGEGADVRLGADELRFLHLNKTAALLTSSIRLGAMTANADPASLDALTRFGNDLGLAFQIIDDILDVTQTSEKLGKSAGKDEANAKSTYPSLFGLGESRREAARLTESAHRALDHFGARAKRLREIASHLLDREY